MTGSVTCLCLDGAGDYPMRDTNPECPTHGESKRETSIQRAAREWAQSWTQPLNFDENDEKAFVAGAQWALSAFREQLARSIEDTERYESEIDSVGLSGRVRNLLAEFIRGTSLSGDT